jgi:hypothetical protein
VRDRPDPAAGAFIQRENALLVVDFSLSVNAPVRDDDARLAHAELLGFPDHARAVSRPALQQTGLRRQTVPVGTPPLRPVGRLFGRCIGGRKSEREQRQKETATGSSGKNSSHGGQASNESNSRSLNRPAKIVSKSLDGCTFANLATAVVVEQRLRAIRRGPSRHPAACSFANALTRCFHDCRTTTVDSTARTGHRFF